MKLRHFALQPTHTLTSVRWPLVVVMSASLSLSLAGCGKKDAQAAGGAPGAMPPPEVIVAVAHRGAVDKTVELAGRTNAYQLSPVIPQVGGIIIKRLFTEGALVKAGQPLYQIDPATYQASVDAAAAAVQRNKANLAALKVTGQRYQALVASNAVSKLEYDNAFQQIALSEADLASSEASLRSSQINLAYTTVRSPITGQSGVSSVTPGALVVANQTTALVNIQQMDPMYVNISQSSADMLKLRQQIQSGTLGKSDNASITLTLEDGSTYPIKGQLQFSNASVDQTTGSVILRAIVPNPSGTLLPGMYVKARLAQGVVHDGILLPQQAVSHDPKGNANVLVVGPDGTVSPRTITLAGTQGNLWIVSDGLQDGERVIVEGLQKAKPGAKVKAIESDPNAPASANAPVSTAKPAATDSKATHG